MAPTIAFCCALLSLAQTVLPAYYPLPPPNTPTHTRPRPPDPLTYPHALYNPTNNPNNTYRITGHDFAFGVKAPRDQLLLHTTVYKKPGIWSSYASKELTFPPPGSPMRVNITQVNAYDRGRNGTGGFVKLARGGIGGENVTLVFRSQKNKAINFEVEIFGVGRP